MKHVLIVGHPDPDSFTLTLAKTYAATVSGLGHACITRDLYRLAFDPLLKVTELPDHPNWTVGADVEAERDILRDADVFALIYPLWFNAPPAIIKGYIERVMGAGFGYARLHAGGQGPLLTDRQLISVTASGSSAAWLNEQGAFESLRNLFDTYLGRVCGMRVRPHIHFELMTPGLEKRWVDTNLKTLETQLKEYFS